MSVVPEARKRDVVPEARQCDTASRAAAQAAQQTPPPRATARPQPPSGPRRRPPAPAGKSPRTSAPEGAPRGRGPTWLALLDRPLASYHLILGCTGLLLAIGLVMVLSTSSASQLDSGGSPYTGFAHRLIGALVGLRMIWGLSR